MTDAVTSAPTPAAPVVPAVPPVKVPPPLSARFQVTGVIMRAGGTSVELTQVGGDSISGSETSLSPKGHAPSAVLTIDVSPAAADVLSLGTKFDAVLMPVKA